MHIVCTPFLSPVMSVPFNALTNIVNEEEFLLNVIEKSLSWQSKSIISASSITSSYLSTGCEKRFAIFSVDLFFYPFII